jgi:hypothetical protein
MIAFKRGTALKNSNVNGYKKLNTFLQPSVTPSVTHFRRQSLRRKLDKILHSELFETQNIAKILTTSTSFIT